MIEYRSQSFLESGLAHIRNSPADNGILEMIVTRPAKKARSTPHRCTLSSQGGVEGDHWAKGCWKSLPDGSPDPAVQVAIMNSRCLGLISASKSQWSLAGDNLIVDLDLSIHNLKPGQRLSIGTVILEITAVPHNGCASFKDRYGGDALKFISTKGAKELRLRGIYARVIQDGEIQLGDHLRKLTA